MTREGDGTVTFTSEMVSDRRFYLRADGRGVTRTTATGGGVLNVQAFAGPWERFRIQNQPDGTVAIASAAFPNVFIRMQYGDNTGIANLQYRVGGWEKFRLVDVPDVPQENKMVHVPNLLPLTPGQAKSAIQSSGLTYKETVLAGPALNRVVSQNPRPEMLVGRPSVVEVTVTRSTLPY